MGCAAKVGREEQQLAAATASDICAHVADIMRTMQE